MQIGRITIRTATQTVNIAGNVLCAYCLEKADKHINLRENDDYYCKCDMAMEEQRLREEHAWLNSQLRQLLQNKEKELEDHRRKNKNLLQLSELQYQHELKMLNKKFGK